MISHRLQSVPITGYYQYFSQNRHRVNITPFKGSDSKETMTATTATPSVSEVMNDSNRPSATSFSTAENTQESSSDFKDKDVTKWTSIEVQTWVEEQCKQFELKKATTEKFQMNGQALVLLTKHDFLRRSPDGGEILYYALQRLINPNKFNSLRTNQSVMRNGSSRPNPRIVEIGSDTDEQNSCSSSSTSTKPIIEEPDDPPLLDQNDSNNAHEDHQYEPYSHSFMYHNAHIRPPVFAMPTATPYFHPQQVYANGFVYAHQHMHTHVPHQHFFQPHPHPHPQFIHQYYPTMSSHGILIEILDDEDLATLAASGVKIPTNETSNNDSTTDDKKQLFLVSMNGQQYVMTELQAKQFVNEVHQQQQRQFQQQQQQQYQQQQQHYQQQQQHYQQQQQQFQQQQQQPQQQPQQQQQQPQFHQQQQPQFHQQQHQQPQYHHQQHQYNSYQQQQPTQENKYYTA